jgi:flagellar basal-body rod modification protein FlgD
MSATMLSDVKPSQYTETPQTPPGSSASAKDAAAIKQQFLTMLVAQLTNQDPLNPLDNAQLTSQLAQIANVESMEKLNNTVSRTLGSIQKQIAQGQSVQTTQLVGKDVLVPGNRVLLGTDPADPSHRESTPLGIDFATAAADAMVKIIDASGAVVRTIPIGPQSVGITGFSWDGLNDDGVAVPDGAYKAAAVAQGLAGAELSDVTMLTYGRIHSVAYTQDGVRLDLGTAGQVSMNDIKTIF